MKGYYHYDTHKDKYIWIVECMNVQVASGECDTKSQMNDVRQQKYFVNWSEY